MAANAPDASDNASGSCVERPKTEVLQATSRPSLGVMLGLSG